MSQSLRGRTALITGGSRGIGLAIATRIASEGANVVLLAKTDNPHPVLPGTIHTAVEAVRAAGGNAVGVVGDVRCDADVQRAVQTAADTYGGLDIVVNNASAIDLAPTREVAMNRYDLMMDVNVRGAFLTAKLAEPYLRDRASSHLLTLSPPLNPNPRWLGAHPAYTMSKYIMSLLTLCLAEEWRDSGIRVNSLWPRTLIATSAVRHVVGGEEGMSRARTPQIMADAACAIFTSADPPSGQLLIDDDVLTASGTTDLDCYRADPDGPEVALDLFIDSTSPTLTHDPLLA